MKKLKAPDTYVIIFFVVLFAAALTYFIPPGKFETRQHTYQYKGKTRTKTVLAPSTFETVKQDNGNSKVDGVPIFGTHGETGFLNYAFDGLTSGDKWGTAVGVVAFILVIGGAFGIVMETGAIESGILKMAEYTKDKDILIIPVMFFLFSLGGAVFGMGEEAIAFAMILVPMMVALGFDSITGVLVTFVATQIGFATSWMNPFGVAIAQGVAGVPVMSGALFRIFMWSFFTLVGIVYTTLYAKKIKKNPTQSLAYETDAYFRDDLARKEDLESDFSLGDKLVVLAVLLTVIWIIYGVVAKGYYIPEIASQFFVMGLIAGVIGVIFNLNNMKINDIAKGFRQGARDLLGAALVVGMAKGIILVLGGEDPSQPSVLNTILYTAGNSVADFSASISAWFMYVFQSIFNFFVVSGSGQAALTMPLMAPLADIVKVNRQVAVLAFQLGDGFTNIIVPTSAALMGTIGVAHLDWTKWAKFQFKLQIGLFLLGSLFVIGAALFGFH
ncbi:MAG TPA: putative basic amino acid antiporter YfcC [bacterium]|nr:putative basic amino acid antiporter YfcC [bacterium]